MNKEEKQIVALVVEQGEYPELKTIDNTLKSLQSIVGGNIQAIYPYTDKVALICNEDGKIAGLDLNRAVYDEANHEMIDIMTGTFIVVGLGEEDFASLLPEQAEKYSKMFHMPEVFVRLNDEILAIPQKPSVVKELQKQHNPAKNISKTKDKERPPEL